MLTISKYRDKPIKELFEKYIRITGLHDDKDFYGRVRSIKDDVNFYNELVRRTKSLSSFGYEVRLSSRGTIYQGFLHRVNNIFNYYDFDMLSEYVYLAEVLKRLFTNYWVDCTGINEETARQILEFHVVVSFYMDIKQVEDYCYDFIGSSYGNEQFKTVLEKLRKEQTAQVSDTTTPNKD